MKLIGHNASISPPLKDFLIRSQPQTNEVHHGNEMVSDWPKGASISPPPLKDFIVRSQPQNTHKMSLEHQPTKISLPNQTTQTNQSAGGFWLVGKASLLFIYGATLDGIVHVYLMVQLCNYSVTRAFYLCSSTRAVTRLVNPIRNKWLCVIGRSCD